MRARDIEATAAAWLARRDAGPLSPEDEAALEAWLAADPAHRVAWLRLEAAWAESDRLQALGAGLRGDGPPPRGAWPGLAGTGPATGAPDLGDVRFRPRRARRRAWPWAAAAAVALLALAAGWTWYAATGIETATYRTALGHIDTVRLPDGSQATLSSDSRVTVRLSRRERRVVLEQGEAFFEAAKDASRPFVVAAGERRVVVVGTRFSVRRDGPDLRVVVTEGSVRLESAPADGRPQPAALLPAGSVALARREGVLVRTVPLAEAEQLVDWRSGLLVFRDVTLAEAAAEFNRYNRRKIEIADAKIASLRIGGSFRWENAEAFVRLLEQGFPVRADYGRDRIILRAP